MRGSGSDGRQPHAFRKRRKLIVSIIIPRMPVVSEFNADPIAAEQVDEESKLTLSVTFGICSVARVGKCPSHRAFAAASENEPFVVCVSGELFKIEAGNSFLRSSELPFSDREGQPAVPAYSLSQHQEVRCIRIWFVGLVAGETE